MESSLIARLGRPPCYRRARTRSSSRPRVASRAASPSPPGSTRSVVIAGALVGGKPRAHHGVRAEQVGLEHQLVGHAGRRLLAPAVEPQPLHLGGHVRVAGPAVGVVVEVVLARAHRAQAEGQAGLARRDQPLHVVAEGHEAARLQVELGERAARAGGARGQRVGEDVRVLGHERGAEPAVRDLARHLEALRRERGQVDRQDRLGRRGGAEGLALAAGQRQLVDLALVLEALALHRAAHDLDRLAHALDRPVEADAVPALDHLRPAHAQAQQEAAVGHGLQAHRGHGQQRGRAGARLQDPGAEADARGARGHEGQRGDAVVAPGLRGPDVVHAQALGLGHVGARLRPVGLGEPQRDRDAHQAGRDAARAVAIFWSWPA